MRKRHIFAIGYWLLMIIGFVALGAQQWNAPIKIGDDRIPTILNGLASSISLCVGLTGTMIVFLSRNGRATTQRTTHGIAFVTYAIISALGIPISTLFQGYYDLLFRGESQEAVRQLFYGMAFSVFLLMSTLIYAMAIHDIE